MIKTTVNKLCVPLHEGIQLSALDAVILPETGCMDGYVKKTDYIEQTDNEVIVDNVRKKVKFPQCGG